MVKQIWKNKTMPDEIDKQLTLFFASEFWKAVEEGYGVQLEDADFNSPDYNMLKHLQENVYQFSAAKNYAQLKAISQSLLDENGKLRTFEQFRQAAAEINNEFINQWLKAEYNFAKTAAQMASRWQQIEEDKAVLPLLKYTTAGDERVRREHQELEDVTLPVDDPFWSEYYPPNGWNCRCDVQQLTSGRITDKSKITLPEKMPAMFRFNSGKDRIAFPPGHPYYDGLPENVKVQAIDLLQQKQNEGNGNA